MPYYTKTAEPAQGPRLLRRMDGRPRRRVDGGQAHGPPRVDAAACATDKLLLYICRYMNTSTINMCVCNLSVYIYIYICSMYMFMFMYTYISLRFSGSSVQGDRAGAPRCRSRRGVDSSALPPCPRTISVKTRPARHRISSPSGRYPLSFRSR